MGKRSQYPSFNHKYTSRLLLLCSDVFSSYCSTEDVKYHSQFPRLGQELEDAFFFVCMGVLRVRFVCLFVFIYPCLTNCPKPRNNTTVVVCRLRYTGKSCPFRQRRRVRKSLVVEKVDLGDGEAMSSPCMIFRGQKVPISFVQP